MNLSLTVIGINRSEVRESRFERAILDGLFGRRAPILPCSVVVTLVTLDHVFVQLGISI